MSYKTCITVQPTEQPTIEIQMDSPRTDLSDVEVSVVAGSDVHWSGNISYICKDLEVEIDLDDYEDQLVEYVLETMDADEVMSGLDEGDVLDWIGRNITVDDLLADVDDTELLKHVEARELETASKDLSEVPYNELVEEVLTRTAGMQNFFELANRVMLAYGDNRLTRKVQPDAV